MNYSVIRQNELYHHGILGQKWGVRRYQNEDGSLTPAGERRYGTNLDLSDKSRKNIAKIRLGEARRRLDVAKNNSQNKGRNDYRVAELQARVRSAKKEVRRVGKIDRGAKLEAKGRTILGNKQRKILSLGAAYLASTVFTSYLNTRLDALGAQGRLTQSHIKVAKILNDAGKYGAIGLWGIYSANLSRQSSDMRAYYNSRWGGENTINRVGSQEYKDVIERNKKKSK